MTWAGPTWGQWADTVDEIAATRDVANQNAQSAQQWMAYAKRLEAELDEVWNLYREARGNAGGQKRVKEAVIEELQKADPSNALLDQTRRQVIFDEAKKETMAKVRRE